MEKFLFLKLVCQKKMIWWIVEYLQFNPMQCLHILHTVLCTFSYGTDNESLLNNQELFKLVIISFILMT